MYKMDLFDKQEELCFLQVMVLQVRRIYIPHRLANLPLWKFLPVHRQLRYQV